MAYIKTNWINGVTPMNDINLNKIEAGIFDTELQLSAFPVSGAVGSTSWVKFADGTMIQYLKTSSTTLTISTVYGSLFIGSVTWTFDATHPFYAPPVVTCSEYKWGTSSSWGSIAGSPSTTEVSLRGLDVLSRETGTNVTIAAMAIGRWKA